MDNFDTYDNEDMQVELDEMDIRDNIEDSKRPIENDFDDDEQVVKMRERIEQLNSNYFDVDDDDDEIRIPARKGEWSRHYGGYTPILMINDEPIFTINPSWYNNLLMIMLIGTTIYYTARMKQNGLQYYITIAISMLLMLSYIVCTILNPGLYTAKYEIVTGKVSCEICEVIYYQDNVMHCEDCDVCIREQHHHSTIFGKCIGEGNLFYYYLFIMLAPCYLINLLILFIR